MGMDACLLQPQKMVAKGGAVANTTMNFIICILNLGLCIHQSFIDSEFDGNGELVFINFSMKAKSVSCFKQFITTHHAFHTKGSEVSGFVCLLGLFLQLYAITITLNRTYKAWARTTIVGMATLMAAGISMLCLGMLIPKDHAWHTTAVPAIIILVVSFDAAVLVFSQRNDNGCDQHLLRDLVMKLADTSISIYRWVDSISPTHNHWDAEKILNLLGGGLPVLIGAYQIACILYKMGIMSKVVKLLRKIGQVFAGEKEQIAEVAKKVDENGKVEKQVVEQEDVDVVVAVAA